MKIKDTEAKSNTQKLWDITGLSKMWETWIDGHSYYYKSYNEMISSWMASEGWSKSEAVEVAKHDARIAVPDFSEVAQYRVIKYLATTSFYITCISRRGSVYPYYYFETPKYCFSSESYDEALAGLLVSIWKELSEVEREEIRKLLRE